MKDKKRFAKQKKKEKEAKAKVLKRREAIRKEAKEKEAKERLLDIEEKLFRPNKPYIKPENFDREKEKIETRDRQIMEQINRNIEMLKAIQEEYEAEEKAREELNKELDEKGLKTLKEKVEYLKEMEKSKLGGESDESPFTCDPEVSGENGVQED